MRYILIFLLLTNSCFATVLHRYTDKVTGDEMGVSYSGKNNSPAINNPDWNVEVIDESQKKFYMNKHKNQFKAKRKVILKARKGLRKSAKTKLKDLGLTDAELQEILGDTD